MSIFNQKFSFIELFTYKPIKVYDIEARWDKKRSSIKELSNNIRSLRTSVNKDLQSDNEKEALTALVIAIIDKTGERVGNETSADSGHFGVTGLKKKHVTVIGNKVLLDYIGKSGVEQHKSFSDDRIAKALKRAIKNSPSTNVFETSDGFQIKSDRVNRYLDEYNVSAKDLRGYYCNKLMVDKLKSREVPVDEKERNLLFNTILRNCASNIGHGKGTLRTHYMLPGLDTEYVSKGKILDIKNVL